MPPDAIVVGAGPAGSAAAIRLLALGFSVLILEKSASHPPKVCGEYLSPGCRPLLERLGALERILAAGASRLEGMRVHSRSGRILDARYPTIAGADGDAAIPASGLSIRRDVLDPLLLSIALERGARLERGFQVSELRFEGDRVAGVAGRRGGEPEEARARMVVGADGRASVVARRLGAVERIASLDRVAVVGYFEGLERPDAMGEIFLARDRYAILNPYAAGLTNLGMVLSRTAFEKLRRERGSIDLLAEAARAHPPLAGRIGRARAAGAPRTLGPLAYRARRRAAPGARLAGDAAGFLDPFTGEGLFAALRTGELAAESAARELSGGRGAAEAPAEYERAWSAEIGPKWRLCRALQRAVRWPWMAEGVLAILERRAGLRERVMAAVGDIPEAAAGGSLVDRALLKIIR